MHIKPYEYYDIFSFIIPLYNSIAFCLRYRRKHVCFVFNRDPKTDNIACSEIDDRLQI